MTWRTYAADVPRFLNLANRLLIEGQRTNGFTNPRCEGASAGTPGTMPTTWSIGAALGLTTSVVGSGSEGGIDYVDVQFTGSPSSTGNLQINHITTNPAASDGQVWTYSLFSRLVGGSLTNVGNAILALNLGTANSSVPYTLSTDPLITQRRSSTATAAGGTTAAIARWRCAVTNGLAVDFTVRIGWPQIEQGAFASTPILPPVGSPGASTRGADILSGTLSALGITSNGACTILGTAVIPQNAPTGANQALFQVSDGSDNNRFMLRNVGGGATIVPAQVVGGSTTDGSSAGSMTAGTLFKWGAAINGAGRMAVSIDGAAVVTVTGGPTSGLTTLRLGNNFSGTAGLFGELGTVTSIARALSDAELVARVNALA